MSDENAEAEDIHVQLLELQADLRSLSFDGVFRSAGLFHAVYLTNNVYMCNQFDYTCIS